ncbi:MAG TPA: CRTAC1 family protein, partial [Saprospiraceae bacterium]
MTLISGMTFHSTQTSIFTRLPFSLILLAGFVLVSLLSCKETGTNEGQIPGDEPQVATSPLLVLRSSGETGITFRNKIIETFDMNITTNINTYNGGGVAVLDANKDGLQDLYFISCSGENKFYLNQGEFSFKDITSTSGLGSPDGFEVAVTVVDINADTWPDLYVCRSGTTADETRKNKLFINNKDLTFTESSALYHIDDQSASMGANFFDYDNDGDLDLYLLNYPVDFSFSSKINVKPNAQGNGVVPILDPIDPYDTDRLYRNDGPVGPDGSGGFKDVSKEAGIWNFGYGLSVAVEDFNQDGWMDVYVANDFIQPDLLYINNKNGTFTNQLGKYFKHTAQHTMGTDLNDFDNDGLFDVFAVDMLSKTNYRKKTLISTNSQNKYNTLIRNGYFPPVVRNVLQRNNGNSTFSDIACMADVFQTDWSWSSLLADMDNDGWKDILVTNGYHREVADIDFVNFTFAEIKAKGELKQQFKDVYDFLDLIPQYKLNDFVFRNKGDLTFEDKGGDWMTMPPTWSNGAVTADLDNDGDLDYVVNNIDDEPFIYDNQSVEKNIGKFLQVVCNGPSSNPFGIGTQVRIYYGKEQQYSMLSPTRGIFSSVEHLIHFGVGSHSTIDRVDVTWPDGKVQSLTNVSTNQRITLDYKNASIPDGRTKSTPATWYKDIAQVSKFKFNHDENDFIDFETTFMMPWALSDLGPLCASADVNEDGLTDIYIGNSFGKPG